VFKIKSRLRGTVALVLLQSGASGISAAGLFCGFEGDQEENW